MSARPAIALALALAAALAGGCATGGTSSTSPGYAVRNRYPKEYRTVAVNVFRNDTYDRPLNGQLTEAIIKEIQAVTPYRIASEARADTLLRGTVRRRNVRELSKSRSTGLTEEALYEVTIDWEWVDQRTGKVIVARNEFTASALFVPSRPSSEPTEIGRFAVVQNLASDVVANMQANW
jgi:hypothetical protein